MRWIAALRNDGHIELISVAKHFELVIGDTAFSFMPLYHFQFDLSVRQAGVEQA